MRTGTATAILLCCTGTGHAWADADVEATLAFAGADGRVEQAQVRLLEERAGLRSYEHATSLAMRDGASASVRYREEPGLPVLRSGSLAFDALFALGLAEMRANAVDLIRDRAYGDSEPIACRCFETGEKWHYVWTRDAAYAAHLGLALLDPGRARRSLEFKLSGYRDGVVRPAGLAVTDDGLQVVQDTGSGGSWPVSTDRVSWAFGAEATLAALPPAQRPRFARTALRALVNTIESDRVAAFDPNDGLYSGEQSFLDWREQTYGAGIGADLARLASAKALSTNVAHYQALRLAARLAQEQGQHTLAQRYRGYAGALRQAINARFWLEGSGMYSSMTAGHLDGAALARYDWLGQSLAVVAGVAGPARAARMVAAYPHGPLGAPVIHPQQPGVRIYHNRAIWPFVTAYGLKAAIAVRNVAVADAAYATLVRGAALHLSNMENMEWLTGHTLFRHDRQSQLDGPVINSRRQLWSVGGYLGMVVQGVFGIAPGTKVLAIRPFVTARLQREQLGGARTLRLSGLVLRGREFDVRIGLPPARLRDGVYRVAGIRVNGKPAGARLSWSRLERRNRIDIALGALERGGATITRISDVPGRSQDGPSFAPYEPQVASVAADGLGRALVRIGDRANGAASVSYAVYRNGVAAASGWELEAWTDPLPTLAARCYAVAAVARSNGAHSHHSAPVCIGAVEQIGMDDARVRFDGGSGPGADGVARDWGAPGQRLFIGPLVLASGRYSFQFSYRNTSHTIGTGVTNAVKLLTLRDARGRVAARGVLQMPHLPPDGDARDSTPLEAALAPGRYQLELGDFFNMSYLQSNARYDGPGGVHGMRNHADLASLRILRLE